LRQGAAPVDLAGGGDAPAVKREKNKTKFLFPFSMRADPALAYIEDLCAKIFQPTSGQGTQLERHRAEQQLQRQFPTFSDADTTSCVDAQHSSQLQPPQTPLECVFLCQKLLLNSGSVYAQVYAVNHLRLLCCRHLMTAFTAEQRVGLSKIWIWILFGFLKRYYTFKRNADSFLRNDVP
jgi:hypothetical protein